MENKRITAAREGTCWEGDEVMGSQTSLASSDISSGVNIMTGFLSYRNASTSMWPQRGFVNDTSNSKTCLAEQGQDKRRGPQNLPHQHYPKWKWGESSCPILGEEGRDPGLQEQCRQMMCQLDAITVAPSPVKFQPSSQGQKRRNWSLQQPWTLLPPCLRASISSSWQWISMGWD